MSRHPVAAILVVLGTVLVGSAVARPMDALPEMIAPDDRPIVMGFATEGLRDASLPWSSLTDVVCFSLEAKRDGRLHDGCGWPWTGFVKKARSHDVRVSLCVTARDGGDIESLVTSREHRDTFFKAVVESMREGGVTGLNIDFENFESTAWIGHMPDFMSALTRHVHAAIPDSFVTVCVPAHDQGGKWDFDALAPACDAIFIMGYDYNGAWSRHPGPSAPLAGDGLDLAEALRGPFGKIVKTNPKKLVLGMPFYGNEWVTSSAARDAKAVKHVGTMSLKYVDRDRGNWEAHWDDVSQTPWWTFRKDGRWHQVWAEDARSIGAKVDLAMKHRLGGVGVWRLGFGDEGGRAWKSIDAAIARGRASGASHESPTKESIR